MEAQKCSLDRMKNEQQVNKLGIELARSQQTLVQCINSIQPQMALSLGLKNLVRTAKVIESLEALNYFNNAKSEEMLDNLQHKLLDSIAENTALLGKRRTLEHRPASPPTKLEKKEEQSFSEDEYSSEGMYPTQLKIKYTNRKKMAHTKMTGQHKNFAKRTLNLHSQINNPNFKP